MMFVNFFKPRLLLVKYPSCLGPGACRGRDPDGLGCSGTAAEQWHWLWQGVVRSDLSRWKVVPCETDGERARSMATGLVWSDCWDFCLFCRTVEDLSRRFWSWLWVSLGWSFEERLYILETMVFTFIPSFPMDLRFVSPILRGYFDVFFFQISIVLVCSLKTAIVYNIYIYTHV